MNERTKKVLIVLVAVGGAALQIAWLAALGYPVFAWIARAVGI